MTPCNLLLQPCVCFAAGLYGATDDPAKTAPIKFLFANSSATWKTGSGAWRFQLTNTRTDLVFHFLRGGPASPIFTPAYASNVVKNLNPGQPVHAHLSLVPGDASRVRVQWGSGGPNAGNGAAHLHALPVEGVTQQGRRARALRRAPPASARFGSAPRTTRKHPGRDARMARCARS